MQDYEGYLNDLSQKLNRLQKQQELSLKEIYELKAEINRLKGAEATKSFAEGGETIRQLPSEIKAPEVPVSKKPENVFTPSTRSTGSSGSRFKKPRSTSDFEKFIGENLANKIGIIILVIGVAIGVKYAIDNDLISPATRIVLGYIAGISLFVFAIRLKKNYENFSAVLLSGSMAIMYFITYSAYSFYNMMPQLAAFILMALFTAFTVFAALKYNRQIIAHIGLVGAYAVPFLLSDGSGKAAVLFSYMAIINCGILVISFRQYWKPLFYSAFVFTWAIFYAWYINSFIFSDHFTIAIVFITIFFIVFYTSFIVYKLLKNEKFDKEDIVLLLANSFIFYGIGYVLIDRHPQGDNWLGIFTILNAAIHFVVTILIYRKKLADKNLFYMVAGLVLVFITIAIPVQLEGSWVTMLWFAEAAMLFWLGRTRRVPVYEKLSYAVMMLAFISLLIYRAFHSPLDYSVPTKVSFTLLFNEGFLTALVAMICTAFITWTYFDRKFTNPLAEGSFQKKAADLIIPAALILIIYLSFRNEISYYFNAGYSNSFNQSDFSRNDDLIRFKSLWILNYSMLFVSALAAINIFRIKNTILANVSLVLGLLLILIFLTNGQWQLQLLRESFLNSASFSNVSAGGFNIGVRYISIALAALTLLVCWLSIKRFTPKPELLKAFEIFTHITILAILSFELINWIKIYNPGRFERFGLSILWGLYALMLIIIGIWKKKIHLRFAAIILFGITLVKLLLNDLSFLNTISKTIVFVVLGVLLLVISFLYNKYKNIIFGDDSK